MKTIIGNSETDTVTTINTRYDRARGHFITKRQRDNAMRRMGASTNAFFINVAVQGAHLSDGDVSNINLDTE